MEGLERRAATRDNLRGAVQVTPVLRQAPGQGSPAQVRLPSASSFDLELGAQVANFAQGKLAEAVKIKQDRSMMEGAMARHQGATFEQVEMDGDKWALEGYRVVDAQTMASSLMQAQKAEIENGMYESDPETYREHMMNRIEGVLAGTKDRRTADLVREQFLQQMPVLVEAQTTAHLSWKEQKNFESVEHSVDVISRDPTAIPQLIEFARGGNGTATAGMSDDRRRTAVVAGVVRAFENGNPLAYAALSREGLLGDDLTTEQINAVQSAKSRFESRRRSEYDESLFTAEQDITRRIENGELEPMAAVEEWSTILSDHHITMNAQDAGQIYTGAENGVRTATATRGMLIEEAMLRGDRRAAANVIIDSLVGTESSNIPTSHNRIADGREHGGLIQMGQARLDDYAAATGTPRITPRQFSQMTRAQQKSINEWHIMSVMDNVMSKYGDRVGTKVHGVTVTMAGMVAAQHLGGAKGLDALMRGEVRSDEYGTSTLDYMRKHGAGAMDEVYTPEQRYAQAQTMLTQTKDRLALDAYAELQPELDQLDSQFTAGNITREDWQRGRDNMYDYFNVERTKADINHERSLTQQSIQAADSIQTELNEFEAGYAIRESQARFEAVATAFETGQATKAELDYALRQMQEDRMHIMSDNNIPLSASQELADVDRMVARMDQAMKAGRKHAEDGAVIASALNTHTLGGLEPALQQRGVKEFKDGLMRGANDRIARGEDPSIVGAATTHELFSFYAEQGVVDDAARRSMNGMLAQPMIDKDGNPNPAYVEAVETYDILRQQNSTTAERYLDEANAASVHAVIARAAGGSIAEAVRSVGVSKGSSRITGSPSEYINRPDVQQRIEKEADSFIERADIGVLQAIWQQSADWNQIWDRTTGATLGMHSDSNRQYMREEIIREVETLSTTDPYLNPSDLVGAAAERFSRRASFIGGSLVVTAPGTSIGEMFFGAQADTMMANDGAINSAVAEWMRSPEAIEQYPYFADRTILGTAFSGNEVDAFVTGIRPFTAYSNPLTGQIYIEVQDSSGAYRAPVAVPTAQAGRLYMRKMRDAAID